MRDSTVPFERILAPIPPGTRKDQVYAPDGSGRDYAYDYEEIEEARRVVEAIELRGDEHDAKRQGARRDPKPAEWDKVFAIGVKVLSTESKDLRVAAWVVEALGHLRGFVGLRDGFAMFRRLQGRYWDSAYPGPADDPEARRGPYEFLDNDRNLPLLIRGIPITFPTEGVPLSYLRRKEAERHEKESAKSAARDDSNAQDRAEGRLTLEDWKAAIELTPPREVHRIAGEVSACLVAFKAWEKSTDRLCRGLKHAPSLTRIGGALIDCALQVGEMLPDPAHREAEALALALRRFDGDRRPPAIEPTKVPDPPGPPIGPGPGPGPGARPGPVVEVAPRPPATAIVEPEPPPEDAESAYRRVREAAAFLRDADPDDPVPYLLIRSIHLGGLLGRESGEPRPGPSRETRKDLRRLAAEGAWDDVVELTEEVISGPEGRGWLDAHRLAIRGLEGLGRDRAARACLGLLATTLDLAPGLADAELDDGTAAASAETRAWLASLAGEADSPGETAIDPAATDELEAGPDFEAEAGASLRDGRVDEAIMSFSAALGASTGDRGRYLATVRFAEACLDAGLDRLALPLLEGLESRPEEMVLGAWEGRDFFAGAATMLHDILARVVDDPSSDRLARARARLARLAPAEGLRRALGGRPD